MSTAPQQSAVARVFGITELVEAVLLQLDVVHETYHQPNRQVFALQRVNRHFRDTIVGSKILQEQATTMSFDLKKACEQFKFERTLFSPPTKRVILSMHKYLFDCFGDHIRDAFFTNVYRRKHEGESWRTVLFNSTPGQHLWTVRSANWDRDEAIFTTSHDTTLGCVADWWESTKPVDSTVLTIDTFVELTFVEA